MNISRRDINIGVGALLTLPLTAGMAFAQSQSASDKAFTGVARRWFNGAMRLGPVAATQVGDHRFDKLIDDLSANGRKKSLDFANSILTALASINKAQLSRANQTDYAILENSMRQQVWQIEKVQEWAWNPLVYQGVAGSAIYNLMARDFGPLNGRLVAATARMQLIPNILSWARSELQIARVPLPHAQTYSAQNAGLKSIITDMIGPQMGVLRGAEKTRLIAAINVYNSAIDAHQKWIDETLVPNAKGDFRVGAEVFDTGLGFTLMSNLSRGQIKERANRYVISIRNKMYDISKKILDAKNGTITLPDNPTPTEQQNTIRAALDLAAAEHPPRDKLVETATSMTELARQFVVQKDLMDLPNGPVKIILMPEFQRGYAGAYCDSPGPLETHLPTFYAVSPVPDDWTEEQVTSFLREENNRNIQDIAVHEAMPGHYVQIYHANKYKSILRAILGSGSFVEGWAVYAEQLMVEEGFKSDDPLYELSQLKVQLRTVVNSLIDQEIHCEGMSREECMIKLTQTAFQEEREAAGKWRRAQLSYNQLSTYFVGFIEHSEARTAAKAKLGNAFNLKKFHNGILSFGAPPVRFARALLLGEAI